MNVRLAVPALVGAVLMAGSAFAAAPLPSTHPVRDLEEIRQDVILAVTDRCTSLEKQWDGAMAQHKTDAKFTEAQKYFNDGTKLCNGSKKEDGVKMLEKALNTIGVHPVS